MKRTMTRTPISERPSVSHVEGRDLDVEQYFQP